MRRSVLAVDRFAAALLGIVLVAAGLGTAAWYNGTLRRLWPAFPERLSTRPAADLLDTTWWPWASGAAGAVLVLLGLWWLLAHLPRRSVGSLTLPGSSRAGRLRVDPSGPAGTAADILADAPGIRSAHSKVIRDRGELVVALTATIDPRADLGEAVTAADEVAADLRTVLGRDDAHARIHLSVARRARAVSRVR